MGVVAVRCGQVVADDTAIGGVLEEGLLNR